MNQIYHNYETWECFKNGMWTSHSVEKENVMFSRAYEFTSDYVKYGKAMMEVVKIWTNSMEHHLTDMSINRRAYVGHCAVAHKLGIPEHVTRKAWHYLTKEQQDLANAEADKAIAYWERSRSPKREATLFDA